MELSKHYANIRSQPLASLLNDFKEALAVISLDNDELRYKYELICEELITNSYYHAKPIDQDFDIYLSLSTQPARIVLKEIGTQAIDAEEILRLAQAGQNNIDQLNPGGLGISLILQLSQQFSCQHDALQSVNIFEVIA